MIEAIIKKPSAPSVRSLVRWPGVLTCRGCGAACDLRGGGTACRGQVLLRTDYSDRKRWQHFCAAHDPETRPAGHVDPQ